MALSKETIDRLMGNNILAVEEIEKKYPPRQLSDTQYVTRIAPSPTGFMHIGGIYAALISERFAHQSNGVFILRIEDTDTKREIEGATDLIIRSLKEYGLTVDEGPINEKEEIGAYGPYTQSKRKDIYQAYVKQLLEKGMAYPCFCTEEEIEAMRERQTKAGGRPGYYGLWAKDRNLTEEQVVAKLDAGKPFVIRFKSPGKYVNKIAVEDILRGKRFFPENDLDIVILKSDGLPTYHFAHVVDDRTQFRHGQRGQYAQPRLRGFVCRGHLQQQPHQVEHLWQRGLQQDHHHQTVQRSGRTDLCRLRHEVAGGTRP